MEPWEILVIEKLVNVLVEDFTLDIIAKPVAPTVKTAIHVAVLHPHLHPGNVIAILVVITPAADIDFIGIFDLSNNAK